MSAAQSGRPHKTTKDAGKLPEFFRDYQSRFASPQPDSPAGATDSKRSRKQSPVPFVVAAVPEVPRPWRQQLKEWLLGPDGRAGAASLALHAITLMSLYFFVMKGQAGGNGPATFLSQADSETDRLALENILEHDLAATGGSIELNSSIAIAPLAGGEQLRPEVTVEATVADLNSQFNDFQNSADLLRDVGESGGAGHGKGVGKSFGNLTDGYSIPGGGKAVRKGKFTAWTVPADPRPHQSYLIIIQVEWPKTTDKKLLRNRRNDLTGTVVGTDNYFQVIEQTGYFIPKSNQMVVAVPGAEQNVEDVIQVHSKILDESQELKIVF